MDNQLHKREKDFLGSGWAFPVTFSAGNHELNLTQYENNINDNIDIVLQTMYGERPLTPQFGSGLRRFFFKNMTPTLKAEIRDAVESSLLDNEPRITVLDIQVDFVDQRNGLVEIHITYMYNQTNTRHNYVFPFYIKEGTNLGITTQ